MVSPRTAVAAAVAISAACALAFASAAGGTSRPSGGTLSISPALVDTVATADGSLPAVTVRNGTTIPFELRIYPAFVVQRIDGGLDIRGRAAQLRAAARRFALSARRVTLGPATSKVVQLKLLGSPPAAEVVGAAVFDAVPLIGSRRRPPYRLRILGALLVRGAKAPAARGRIEVLRVTAVHAGRLRFTSQIHNLGRVHAYPVQVRLEVRTGAGRVVLRAAPTTGVVLPGFARNVSVDTRVRLRAGRYVARWTCVFGPEMLRASAPFTLAGTNRPAR